MDQPVLTVSVYRNLGQLERSDSYLEICWLPITGPSSVCVIRHLDRRLETAARLAMPVVELAGHCGIGSGTGRNSIITRTLHRLDKYGLARFDHDSWHLQLPEALPTVPGQLVRHLPPLAVAYHHATVNQHLRHPAGA